MDVITPIAKVMMGVLQGLNLLTHSYGLSLILFACFVKLLLYYPTAQQYRSIKDIQRLQPEIERLKKQYADDPTKLNQEMMDLYKVHKVNPLGGCGPMLLQMPILIAIWRAIMGQPDLFGRAYFLWIHPGPLQSAFPDWFASSLADRDLALVIVYGVTMFLSQSLSPSQTGDSTQKMMGIYMTGFFTWMIWRYKWPCALVLYWSVFQFLSIVQQLLVMREKPAEPKGTELATAGI